VIIVQENRSLNNLFMNFPGATTATSGQNSYGQTVTLVPQSLTAHYDLGHLHESFKREYAGGAMNGWDLDGVNCARNCPPKGTAAFAYVPQSEVQPYWDMATQYVLGDEMFQSNEGPSFPAHQYLISGTSSIANGSSLLADDNPSDPQHIGSQGGCDSLADARVKVIDSAGKQHDGPFPCFDRTSIFDELDTAGISWRYYQWHSGSSAWNAVDAIKQIWQKPEYATNVVYPPSQVLTDIAAGNLASVSFVTPTAAASDHALKTDGSGPAWVASIVNAIGGSQYWNSTAIFEFPDDWGGFFDPVTPTVRNSYELGFRVPLLVISPYAKSGYVSHVPHEFGSILKFIEEEFGLPSMGTSDAAADDLADCFSGSKARPFKRIRAAHDARYFLRQPMGSGAPDDD
jgi:phospholipase C